MVSTDVMIIIHKISVYMPHSFIMIGRENPQKLFKYLVNTYEVNHVFNLLLSFPLLVSTFILYGSVNFQVNKWNNYATIHNNIR